MAGDWTDSDRRCKGGCIFLIVGGVVGLGTWVVGAIMNESHIGISGYLFALGTMFFGAGIMGLQWQQIPIVVDRKKRTFEIRSFKDEPVKGWGMTILILLLGLFFLIGSIGLFFGWIELDPPKVDKVDSHSVRISRTD